MCVFVLFELGFWYTDLRNFGCAALFMGESMIDRNIFRAYDIRGDVATQLTGDVAYSIGLALGITHFEAGARIGVGRDARTSSPELSQRLIDGLVAQGIDVVDLGMITTPMSYYAMRCPNLGATPDIPGSAQPMAGSVMITGSHNPANENGLKICKGTSSFLRDDIVALYEAIANGTAREKGGNPGCVVAHDVSDAYCADIWNRLSVSRKLRIVVDAGNGVAGPIALRVLSHYANITPLYCDPDGRFPHHHPDPSVEANLADCRAKVLETGADLGIAFDGDGDRIGVVDASGAIIAADRLLVLLARDALAIAPHSTILGDVKCSKFTFDDIAKHGGTPCMTKTGHALIKAKIRETHAALAGEMSGHFFFNENWYGFDDAVYTAARLCRIRSRSSRSIEEMLADLPPSCATPELRLSCNDDAKFALSDAVCAYYSARYPTCALDGARVDFPNGWALVRASNTQPVIVARVEGASHDDTRAICDDLARVIDEIARGVGAQIDLTPLRKV